MLTLSYMALAEQDSQLTAPEWTLGDRLAKARRTAGLEQTDMAKLLKVSRATISSWERDEAQPRNLFKVTEAWGSATNTPLDWLLLGVGWFAATDLTPSERMAA